MEERRRSIIGMAAAALLLLAGCEHVPYYDESLNWFSWSKYDPEMKAIEADVPPPGNLQVPPAPGPGALAPVRDGRGGPVTSVSPPNVGVSVGSSPVTRGSAVNAAGRASVADGSRSGAAGGDGPLVGSRNSVGGSVTWRSTRGG